MPKKISLATLQKAKKEIENKIKKAKEELSKKDAKFDERREALIGKFMLAKLRSEGRLEEFVKQMDKLVRLNKDRKLLGLKPHSRNKGNNR